MIITLCGSARFEKWFHAWNEALTLTGHTVFSLAVFPSQKQDQKDWYTKKQKTLLDQAHFRKIEASDAVVFLNAFAYMGASTLNEVLHARRCGKKLYALESWGKGNGIGPRHIEAYQKAAREYGCLNVGSPIDTFYPHFVDVFNLLGPAGELRSSIVERLDKIRVT